MIILPANKKESTDSIHFFFNRVDNIALNQTHGQDGCSTIIGIHHTMRRLELNPRFSKPRDLPRSLALGHWLLERQGTREELGGQLTSKSVAGGL